MDFELLGNTIKYFLLSDIEHKMSDITGTL